MNPIKFWLIVKDDAKRTFEVVGQERNTNSFENKTYAMQRAGMNVSCYIPPVGGQLSHKESIKITNYTKEEGLYERLQNQYRKINADAAADFENEEG
jgi:hypothetical protein